MLIFERTVYKNVYMLLNVLHKIYFLNDNFNADGSDIDISVIKNAYANMHAVNSRRSFSSA